MDRVNRMFTVAICHLTQFAVYFQMAPVAQVQASNVGSRFNWTDLTLSRVSAADIAALPATGALQEPADLPPAIVVHVDATSKSTPLSAPVQLSLNGGDSYDPDGYVTHAYWSLACVPQAVAANLSLPVACKSWNASLSGSAPALALAATTFLPASFRHLVRVGSENTESTESRYHFYSADATSSAVITDVVAQFDHIGWWSVQLAVLDVDDAVSTAEQWVLLNARPVVRMSRTWYQALGATSEVLAAEGSEQSVEFAWARQNASATDAILDASLSSDIDGVTQFDGLLNVSWRGAVPVAPLRYAWVLDLSATTTLDNSLLQANITQPFGDLSPVAVLHGAHNIQGIVVCTVTDIWGAQSTNQVIVGDGGLGVSMPELVATLLQEYEVEPSDVIIASSTTLSQLSFLWSIVTDGTAVISSGETSQRARVSNLGIGERANLTL
ncbi:MAG: hypothetical protein EOO65_04980, partial [Methanosarcinales archaeon]